MGRIVIAGLFALATAAPLAAQRTGTESIPPGVAAEIARVFNDPATDRRAGVTDIATDAVIAGTLAVRSGPVTIAGHVRGDVVAINADVMLRPGARIDGGVLVVGGRLEGRDIATIGGDIRVYAEALRYRLEGDRMVRDAADSDTGGFWSRRAARDRTRFDWLAMAGASTYNRVEGLPILVGPRLRVTREWGSFNLQARGIVRTAEPFEWDRGTLGHDARTDVRWGTSGGFGLGATAFDRIDPVEPWQMGDHEAGLAAFFLHRDFRDYYGRHGGSGYVRAYADDAAWLSLAYGRERWESRDARDPWTLFRDKETWRANPAIDEGVARLVTANVSVDGRRSRFSPGAGWYVQATLERGTLERDAAVAIPGNVTLDAGDHSWTSGFVDIRRYNRIAPRAQLNLRGVFGGWISGDPLPLSRRLSVGGPTTIPGNDFRRHWRGGEDRLQCSAASAPASNLPAMCDRIALLQVEYRGSLSWEIDGDRDREWWPFEVQTPTWSVFFDSGRGWRAGDGSAVEGHASFPDISTFKSDLGIGLDFGSMSLSLAKSITDREEPVNVVFRLSRRF